MAALPYTDLVDEQWTDVAPETMSVDAPEHVRNPSYLNITGSCPRCSDDMSVTNWLVTIAGVSPLTDTEMAAAVQTLKSSGIDVGETLPAEFTVKCACSVSHPDPKERANLVGCGATWRMRVERGQ
jgi:hypothetical protein